MGQRVGALDWQVDITPDGELFPALQLSQAPRDAATAIGGGDGLINVRIRGAGVPTHVHLRIETAGLRTPAIVDTTSNANAMLELHPRLDWDVAALHALPAARRQRLRITLNDEAREIEVRLHPLDDALYFVREGRDHVDLGWAFAGYVNPRDAVVDEVLALTRSIDPDFATDDRAQDAAATLRRVGVVWAALEKHGLRYAGGNPALSQGPVVYSQRVRLLGEVWRERSANCIDSSVLIASVLERLGVRAFIVLVPGHAFVGFHVGTGQRDTQYLETTLLGARPTRRRTLLLTAAANYAAARASGHARWLKLAAKLDGRHGPDYATVDIAVARRYGIIPFAAQATLPFSDAHAPETADAHRGRALVQPFD